MRFVVLLALAPALVLSACGSNGSGGTGDSPSEPSTSKLGDGARLHEVVGEATWLDANDPDSASCDSPQDRHVNVTGVTVIAIDRFDETGQGQLGNFYVQDTAVDAVPFSGITVFAPSFSPPDLRLGEGDVADALGTLMEFLGPSSGRFGECKTLPEIGGTLSFRLENGIREPHPITVEDLKSYESARKWLGMLVRLEDVRIAADASNSSGRYTAPLDVGSGVPASDVPRISNELFDLENEGPPLTQGMEFASVSGVVTYFYGFKLAPRSAADFELP
ncbi:MAG: hypothetical protein WKG00_13345 [Polyangiaceae bacterium]